MSAIYRPIIIEQYAGWNLSGRVENDDGTPVDLTAATARLQVRETVEAATPLLNLCETSGIALGGTAGTFVVSLPAEDTADLTWTDGVYDLVITVAGAEPMRILQGEITVSPGVTRE